MQKVEDLIRKELAYEFDIDAKDFYNKSNIFTVKEADQNFFYNNRVHTSIISYKDKLLVRSKDESLLYELKKAYKDYPGQWFFEAKNIYGLVEILNKYGLTIKNMFPVYAPKFVKKPSHDKRVFWLKASDFEELKKDRKYDFVFTYEEGELGLGFKEKGKIIALVSATRQGMYFYDIGLEKYSFEKDYKSLGSYLLSYLTYYILEKEDRIALSSTQFSHAKSVNLMVNSGYRLAFTVIAVD